MTLDPLGPPPAFPLPSDTLLLLVSKLIYTLCLSDLMKAIYCGTKERRGVTEAISCSGSQRKITEQLTAQLSR
jgi:hypothetical protein